MSEFLKTLAGVVLGAAIAAGGAIYAQTIAGQSAAELAQSQAIAALRMEAYKDFANAQAVAIRESVIPPKQAPLPARTGTTTETNGGTQEVDGDPQQVSLTNDEKLRQAATRLALFAPAEVVRAVAKFTKDFKPRGRCGHNESDRAMYGTIRSGLLKDASDTVSDSDLAMAIFACTLPE